MFVAALLKWQRLLLLMRRIRYSERDGLLLLFFCFIAFGAFVSIATRTAAAAAAVKAPAAKARTKQRRLGLFNFFRRGRR